MTANASLVTGASSGIGRATAIELAANGYDVALTSRSDAELRDLADEIEANTESRAIAIPTDVTDESQVDAMLEETVAEFGRLDAVVSNAGLGLSGDVESMPTEHYETMMGVNCDGMFYTARGAIPHLRETRGNIVFTGSIAGKYPRGTSPVYAATKWWTRGFALSLAAQIGDEDIGITVINPSEVRTNFNEQEGTAFEDAFEEGAVSEPADVADAVVYALSQSERNTVAELDLYRRDKLEDMELG
ncbi:SDR family NAD(P)-dependent oxidoreductase [Halobellus sp. Atlit-31R]|nr:SDR family NAD(P)-dependent oxidoreductase [Halobellus sp. Atlit-31R]